MISVVIPANNEAAGIGRCLESLTRGSNPGEMEVIVVCNGCTDATAEKARSFGNPVVVLETPEASKSNALNIGDRAATGFPRFYIDADTVVPLESIRCVAAALEHGQDKILAAAPRIEFDLRGRPWSVRAFYDIWQRLPYCRLGMIGSGVYAVSEKGRQRFKEFPAITADDGFVRSLFSPHERQTLDDCTFLVAAPRNLSSLIRIKTRADYGNRELRLARKYLDPGRLPAPSGHWLALLMLTLNPLFWPRLAVYAFVRLVSRSRAASRLRGDQRPVWDRDHSSRDLDETIVT